MTDPTTGTLRGRVLVVDDDRAVRTALKVNLAKAGLEVFVAETGVAALELLHERDYDIVLSDVMMPGMHGLQLLDEVKRRWPDRAVVMMTGHGNVEDAVRAMKAGAVDYIIKPVSKDELLVVLERALQTRSLRAQLDRLRAEVKERYGFEHIVGQSPLMREVYDLIESVADSSALVLLTGPTGTGKELFAHAIHYRSPRRDGPFVQVNCGAIPEGLLESELFGHEKGAFTGALRQHAGRFEQADGGTLMLDEIGEIPPTTQVKLLRVLESGHVQRVGGSAPVAVDVRVIAATNRDLRKEVRAGRFREDLFYRLHVFHIALPPLRARAEDLPLLVDHFVKTYAERHKRKARGVSKKVLEQLSAHPWPGNVRELEHVIERAVILCPTEEIVQVDLPQIETDDELTQPPPGTSLPDLLDDTERKLIVDALQAEKGVQARAARRLGVSRGNLNYRIGRLGITVKGVSYT